MPAQAHDKHCERDLKKSPSLEELPCLKTRSDSPKIRNFIKWLRRHTQTSTHTLGLKKIIQQKKQLRIGTLSTTPQGHFTGQPFLWSALSKKIFCHFHRVDKPHEMEQQILFSRGQKQVTPSGFSPNCLAASNTQGEKKSSFSLNLFFL